MKHILLLLSTILLLQGTAVASRSEAIRILSKTAQKLADQKATRYHQYREVSDSEVNYFASNAGDCYYEFDAAGSNSLLARFQLQSKDMVQVYNGTEYFQLHETTKTYKVQKRKSLDAFQNLALLYNSIPTLRKALPTVVQDNTIPKTVRDTLIAGKPYYLVSFSLQNKRLDFPDGFSDFSIAITTFYNLVIDRHTFLPYMVLDSNSKSGTYFTKTVFTQLDITPAAPDALTWFYSSYKDYTLQSEAEPKPLVKLGAMLPEWSLAQYTGNKPMEVRSSELKGKVVLLEFWIKNCGYCVASFPHLKALQARYGQEGLQVLAVNTYDRLEDVAFFYDREKPNYRMLYNGEAFAKSLGAVYYPTVILLDRAGKVVYAGSFDKREVEEAIKEIL